jgi:hypothetical protein
VKLLIIKSIFTLFEYFGGKDIKNHVVLTFNQVEGSRNEIGDIPDNIYEEIKMKSRHLKQVLAEGGMLRPFGKASPKSLKLAQALGLSVNTKILDILTASYLHFITDTDNPTSRNQYKSFYFDGTVALLGDGSGFWKMWREDISGDTMTAIAIYLGCYDVSTKQIADFPRVFDYVEKTFNVSL